MKGQLFLALMLTTLSMVPTLAKAGAGSSGGGNALVCFDTPEIPKLIRARNEAGNIIDGSIRNEHINHITRVEILDLVEAQYPRGMSQPKLSDLIQPTEGEGVEEFAVRIISRFKDAAPVLYDNFMNKIEQMPATSAIAQPDGLNPVDDYNLLGRIDSTNCVVATVAIHQFVSNLLNSPQMYFDQRLMFHPKHSEYSRAITYLHEIIYSYARGNIGQSDSQNTRALVGLLLRKNLKVSELQKMIQSIQLVGRGSDQNLYVSELGNRYDRLGAIYEQLNVSINKIASKELDKVEGSFIEKYAKNPFDELSFFLKKKKPSYCEKNVYCLLAIVKEEAQNTSVFNKKRAIEAQYLLNKYKNYDVDLDNYVMKNAAPLIKDKLKDLYVKDYKEKILSLSNVSMENLKELDLSIENTIDTNTAGILTLVKKRNCNEYICNTALFTDALKVLNSIPQQIDL